MSSRPLLVPFFFFNDTAPTEIYTLSLPDALPISVEDAAGGATGTLAHTGAAVSPLGQAPPQRRDRRDRKSTRLNSIHLVISYAVFCLKKKKKKKQNKISDDK